MIFFHFLRVVLHLFAGLATCAFVFPRIRPETRQMHIRQWSARLLSLCGVQVRVRHAGAAQAATPALIVANHLSWLDIFVINSLQPCRFVAKSDIRNWPLIGWLCEKAGTIFIARGRQRDVRRIYQGLVASIHAGERVAFFPEGMAVTQGMVHPFHANLFEAAIEAGVPVQPYAVRYLDPAGGLHPAADFGRDISLLQSVLAILRSRSIIAELTLLPAVPSQGMHRRELAAAVRRAIAAELDWKLSPAAGIADSRPEKLPGRQDVLQ